MAQLACAGRRHYILRMARPNIVFIFADQWRAQAIGYSGDPNVRTPNLDRLAESSLNCTHALSACPVCAPYRASLLTGQFPLTHGVFINDVSLDPEVPSLAKVCNAAGYDTAYIGKWHIDGHGRSSYIPRERRQGYDFWRVLECTHEYNNSPYYADDSDQPLIWDGYDAIAQTRCAIDYIRQRDTSKPFLLMLSWGPPHNPYETAPERFRAIYDPQKLALRPNVKEAQWLPNVFGNLEQIRNDLAGYYAHCSALDECVGAIWSALKKTGLEEETIFIFTSDHGDMLGSQGHWRKQVPYDESIRVPFLLHWPGALGRGSRELPILIDAPDLMPTLLKLCGLEIPARVEGNDYSAVLLGDEAPRDDEAAVLTSVAPFAEWRLDMGAKEYRGLRTRRHTYVRSLEGPWLLFDNEVDPCQMKNLVQSPDHAPLLRQLDEVLFRKLAERGDEFKPAAYYLEKWGYRDKAAWILPKKV